MWTLLIATALAGYGDAKDGLPSYDERELHVWTNLARMDPEALADDLHCWDEFNDVELERKWPLAYHPGLAEAARFHTADMYEVQALSHTSSDGTDFARRVSRYYDSPFVGENVAYGSPTVYDAVLGWLCSSGHRANIMLPDFTEFGGGVVWPFMTQDFGGARAPRTMNMGFHSPQEPRSDATFFVDTFGPDIAATSVVVNGEITALKLYAGVAEQGMWSGKVQLDQEPCHVYWFETLAGGQVVRFPGKGAYGFGDCAFSDPDAGWLSAQDFAPYVKTSSADGEGGEGSCNHAPSGWWLALFGMFGLRRRR